MICVDCNKFLRVKKSGVIVEEMMPRTIFANGVSSEPTWHPYQLWAADLFECPQCKRQIVSGFGSRPIAEHYQDNYAERRAGYDVVMQINDCGPRHAGPMPAGEGKIG